MKKLGLILMILGLCAASAAGLEEKTSSPKLRRAPDFTLSDCEGKQVSLADFRGRVVLLQFFQTGCPTCQAEAPILEKVYRKFKDQGVVVMGVSHDPGGAEAVKAFAKRFDLTYFLLLGDIEIAVRYLGLTPQKPNFDIPHFFVIDREGHIIKDIEPAHSPDFARSPEGALEQSIEEALASPQPVHPRSTASPN